MNAALPHLLPPPRSRVLLHGVLTGIFLLGATSWSEDGFVKQAKGDPSGKTEKMPEIARPICSLPTFTSPVT